MINGIQKVINIHLNAVQLFVCVIFIAHLVLEITQPH